MIGLKLFLTRSWSSAEEKTSKELREMLQRSSASRESTARNAVVFTSWSRCHWCMIIAGISVDIVVRKKKVRPYRMRYTDQCSWLTALSISWSRL